MHIGTALMYCPRCASTTRFDVYAVEHWSTRAMADPSYTARCGRAVAFHDHNVATSCGFELNELSALVAATRVRAAGGYGV